MCFCAGLMADEGGGGGMMVGDGAFDEAGGGAWFEESSTEDWGRDQSQGEPTFMVVAS